MKKFGTQSFVQKCIRIDKIIKSIFSLVKILDKQGVFESDDWHKIEFFAKKYNEKDFYLIDELRISQNPDYNDGKVGFSNA